MGTAQKNDGAEGLMLMLGLNETMDQVAMANSVQWYEKFSELLHNSCYMQSCISDVKAWATASMLILNDDNIELMLVTSKRTKHIHDLPTPITIDNAQIPFK